MQVATSGVLVLGAGMAGLCAAATAAQAGARVQVLDPAPVLGGSAAWSHGTVWTAADVDALRAADAGAHQRHGVRVVAGFVDATDWLTAFGTAYGPRTGGRRRQAQRFELGLTFLRLVQTITAAGGSVHLDTTVDAIEPGPGSRLTVRAGTQSWTASSVIIATGGRQADPAVRSALAQGGPAMLRGNPYSDGSGIALARGLGGAVNFANDGFYGHLLPAGVPALSRLDYLALTLYHSRDGILLDREGRRFTDERRGDAANALALAGRGGSGVLLWSADTQQRAVRDPAPVDLVLDRYRYAADRGARVAVVDGRAEAVAVLAGWGLGAELFDETSVARLGPGPVYLADVVPAVTFTYGGLRTDDTSAVLDATGQPVAGLFAAGADVSDIYHRGYCGGLSAALVTARAAGRSATRNR
jgi:succinate dehydrogenase/fumarate reductase flavoprotein subunit